MPAIRVRTPYERLVRIEHGIVWIAVDDAGIQHSQVQNFRTCLRLGLRPSKGLMAVAITQSCNDEVSDFLLTVLLRETSKSKSGDLPIPQAGSPRNPPGKLLAIATQLSRICNAGKVDRVPM
jgi:hypothetical protein